MASSSSSTYSNPPCAACKFLRRKCVPNCIFSPYFPPEEPTKFINVHKIFGASNVSKLLQEILPHQREDAVNSLAYEAEARLKDPVYGCVGAISVLQRQVLLLQKELDATNADLMRYTNTNTNVNIDQMPNKNSSYSSSAAILNQNGECFGKRVGYGSGSFDPVSLPYSSTSWYNGPNSEENS